MIVARADIDNPKRLLLILGLTKMNVERLKAGQPIRIRREVHGEGIPQGWEIMICYGETEQHLYQQFKAQGLMGEDTKVHKDPRLGISDET